MRSKKLLVFISATIVFGSCGLKPSESHLKKQSSDYQNIDSPDVSRFAHSKPAKLKSLSVGCFVVTVADAQSPDATTVQMAKDTKRICMSELVSESDKEKITVDLIASTNKKLRSFRFREAVSADCEGCYLFTAAQDGSAKFSELNVTASSSLEIYLQEAGVLNFKMLRELQEP